MHMESVETFLTTETEQKKMAGGPEGGGAPAFLSFLISSLMFRHLNRKNHSACDISALVVP